MSLYFGNSSEIKEIIFNGTNLDKVYFDNVLVFEKKTLKTITETVYPPFRVTNGSDRAYFYYSKSGSMKVELSHTPVKVTAIKGGPSPNPTMLITGDLNGTADFSSSTYVGTARRSLTWKIDGKNLVLYGPNSATDGQRESQIAVTITYTYYE